MQGSDLSRTYSKYAGSRSSSCSQESDHEPVEKEERNIEFAKYWCPYSREVVLGVALRQTPVPLASLCGTYRWFYEIPMPHYSEPKEIHYPSRKFHSSESAGPGHLTLMCPAGRQVSIANISGTLDHYGKLGRFTGIRRLIDGNKQVLLENYWQIIKLNWDAEYGDNHEEQNCLAVLDVCDDDGEPFVMFRYWGPSKGGYEEFVDVIGKKQSSTGRIVKLTPSERSRLGMDEGCSEIRKRAREARHQRRSEAF